MRKTILPTLITLVVLTTSGIGQTPSTGTGKPATLQETLSWLSERLTSDATFSPADKDGTSSGIVFSFVPIRFQGCELEWKSSLAASGLAPGYSVVTVSLGKIDSTKIKVTSSSTPGQSFVGGVSLRAVDGLKGIKRQYFRGLSRHGEISTPDVVGIFFKDADTSARIVKAFQHAAGLCQSQKEPF